MSLATDNRITALTLELAETRMRVDALVDRAESAEQRIAQLEALLTVPRRETLHAPRKPA